MVHAHVHKLSGILLEVFTPLLIKNSSCQVLLQVFKYKYHKDLRATNKPKFISQWKDPPPLVLAKGKTHPPLSTTKEKDPPPLGTTKRKTHLS
jgi:hypothetical protein